MSIFDALRRPFTNRKIKREQQDELRDMFRDVLSDGVINESEKSRINQFYSRMELSIEEFDQLQNEAFMNAVQLAIIDRRVTDREKESLRSIAKDLGISTEMNRWMEEQITHFALFDFIEKCEFEEMPIQEPNYIVLKRDEILYFEIPGQLIEERVVKSEIRGRSAGVGFRVAKGVTFRVGQSRGRLVSSTGFVPISDGEFAVTNYRFMFSGNKKSVSIEVGKVFDLRFYSDAVQFSATNRQRPIIVSFATPLATEYAALVMSRVINNQ